MLYSRVFDLFCVLLQPVLCTWKICEMKTAGAARSELAMRGNITMHYVSFQKTSLCDIASSW
eukprot:5094867-Pleurochrysis_carterae.AAC.1